jgi:hypothetical protein
VEKMFIDLPPLYSRSGNTVYNGQYGLNENVVIKHTHLSKIEPAKTEDYRMRMLTSENAIEFNGTKSTRTFNFYYAIEMHSSFWSLKQFLMSELPMFHKRRLMDSIVLTVFTWGAQSWTLSKADERKLQVEQRAMERKLLKKSLYDHITNEELRKMSGIKDVLEKARELKWDFAGHVQRMGDDRWAKKIVNWTPSDGKRSKGHQLKRWSDEIESVGLARWKIKANDRKLWKSMRETFVHKD